MIELFVPGKPRSAGSKSAFPNPKTGKIIMAPAGKYQKAWMDRVEWAFIQSEHFKMILWEGAIILELEFLFHRPQFHYGTGRNAGKLKSSAAKHKTTQPDATKLLRAVEDALTGHVWRNDAQVVRQVNSKRYCEPGESEGVNIKIQQIKE